MTSVKCSVENCVYWGEGNECHADSIFITHNAGTLVNSKAIDEDHTSCATFKPRSMEGREKV